MYNRLTPPPPTCVLFASAPGSCACSVSMMLGVNTLLHILSAMTLAMLYKQYQDIRLLLETRDDVVRTHTDLGDRASEEYAEVVATEGSSVWCSGQHHTDRLCRFRNLCYLPSEAHYVFFHSSNSVVEGVPDDRFSPALLDMSSIANHNTQYFNYIDIPASRAAEVLQDVEVISRSSLLFRRFNPTNLMHVFHDDLLPMFHTLRLMTMGDVPKSPTDRFSVQLVFMDGSDPGDFYELYQMFSSYPPLMKQDILDEYRPVCFRNVYVGLSKSPTWYQYGFFVPQGPIPNASVSALDIASFIKYTKTQLKLRPAPSTETELDEDNSSKTARGIAVVFTRRHNRIIVNEVDLTVALAQRLQMKVMTLSLETHSLREIIGLLGTASLLIGMHGSLLILAMFLPPGALLVELFPYAVNPDHYTPYRTLASLSGMWLTYRAWRNTDSGRSVVHPARGWEYGGITHLPDEEQARITASAEVPKHLCCRDPEWLFRIYQDTHVDVEAVLSIAEHHLQEVHPPGRHGATDPLSSLIQQRLVPSPVTDMRCDETSTGSSAYGDSPLLTLAFSPPVNLAYLDYSSVVYEVWSQETGTHNISAWILSRTSHTFWSGLKPVTEYLVWVRCVLDDELQGPFNTDPLRCSTA